ncbi:MAG: 4Fe-4S binding protein [Planctomycetota bacterium]|jgi:ferredoxin
MKRVVCLFGLVGLLLCGIVAAENRFPKPEFETEYQYPQMVNPVARGMAWEYIDVGLLIAALVVTGLGVFKWRSRTAVLLTAVASVTYFGFIRAGCICSVGSIQNVALALADPGYRIPFTALLFFVIPLGTALFFGRLFCASVCPLGCLQDLIAWKPVSVPQGVESILRFLPILYLGLGVLYAAAGGLFMICRLDPFIGFFRFTAEPALLLFGVLFVLVGLFVARPYCRFLCPYGVLLGWASFFSKRRVVVTPTTCISCRLCESACPYDAIASANPNAESESPRGRIRRLLLTLVLAPIICWAGMSLAARLSEPLAREHPVVALAERIQAEDGGRVKGTTLASREFRRSAKTIPELIVQSDAIRQRFAVGAPWLGLFLGFVVVGRMVKGCIRRYHVEYTVDRVHCLACARCYAHCPQEPANRIPEESLPHGEKNDSP